MIELFGVSADEISHISLRFSDGENTVLLGGKDDGPETMVQVLSGRKHLSDGSVSVSQHGIDVSPGAMQRFFSRTVAPPVFPARLQVWDLLMLTALAYGMNRRKADYRCERALTALGLEELASMFPAQLPPDWQERVMLAQALVPEAAILALDHPFNGMTRESASDLVRIIRTHADEACVFWLFESPRDAEILDCRNLVFKGGRILFDGTCKEASTRFSCADFTRAFEQICSSDHL